MKPRLFPGKEQKASIRQAVSAPMPEDNQIGRELALQEGTPESAGDATVLYGTFEDDEDRKEGLVSESPQRQGTNNSYQRDKTDIHQSLELWIRHGNALVHSKEMSTFLLSSRDVFVHSTGMALNIACLPVTIPLHVISSATGFVAATCTNVVTSTASIVDRALHAPATGGEDTASFSLIDGLIHHMTNALPIAVHVVCQVKDNVGGTILGLMTPIFGGNSEAQPESNQQESQHRYAYSAGQPSSEQRSFLDRLRLESPLTIQESTEEDHEEEQEQPHISPSDISKYLLRVGDLGVTLGSDRSKTVLYIDLSEEFSNTELTTKVLESMATTGLSLVNTCIHTAIHKDEDPVFSIEWKPEGSTGKILKRQSSCLSKETLIWSGKFTSSNAFQSEIPLFLSRGIVPGSPFDFLELLWDSSRTSEYNRFCLGRINLLVIEQGPESHFVRNDQGIRGSKIVKSQTKVPFTGINVVLSTLMHMCQLEENTFLIVSRSLNSGRAGYHTSTRHVQEGGKSELLWGVNLLRPVPGKPNMTDLTSVSHVSSSLVPHFLASRVGMMGVESVFEAFRSRNKFV